MPTRIEPVTLARADALLAGDDAFAAQFGMPVDPGYLDFPEALVRTRSAVARGVSPDWYSHLIIDADRNTVVGFGGFKGPPEHGEVEIGYSVSPASRRRGHARDAVDLLVAKARAGGATLVVANTLAGPNPSTGVLEGAGFVCTEVWFDAEVGEVWRWELPVARGGSDGI